MLTIPGLQDLRVCFRFSVLWVTRERICAILGLLRERKNNAWCLDFSGRVACFREVSEWEKRCLGFSVEVNRHRTCFGEGNAMIGSP